MDLRSLNVFVEVVRHGGFTAAGQRLGLTQPSISRVIKQLEDEVGQPLMTREHRGVTLTDAGRIVYERALVLLGESARLRLEISDLAGLRRGEVNLGIPPLGGTLFVPLVKLFREKYPAIELRLFEKGSKATENALISGGLELGTLLLPLDREQYDSLPLTKDRLAAAVPPGSRWARRKTVRLAELRAEPFILFPDDFALNDRILEHCREAGFKPQIAGSSGQAQFIGGLVASGIGLALLPKSVLRGVTGVVVVEISDPVLEWNIALAWPRASYLSHAARALIALVKENPLTTG